MPKRKQIKDTNVIKTPEVIIQPQFWKPDDVIDIRSATSSEIQITEEDQIGQDQGDDAGDAVDLGTLTDTSDGGTDPAGGGTSNSSGATVSVYSVKTRITTDGTTVVDVVLAVSPFMPQGYEWRLTVDGSI